MVTLPLPVILPFPLLLSLASGAAAVMPQDGTPGELGGRVYQSFAVFGEQDWEIGKSRPGGDLNGDGKEDFLVGTIGNKKQGPLTQGRMQVHSGQKGVVFRTHLGAAVGDRFGFDYASTGDLNGDDVPEYMVSAPSSDLYGTKRGVVYVYDGATGGELRSIGGSFQYGFIGGAVTGGHDFTGDGVPDLAMLDDSDTGGGSDLTAKVVLVYSGATIDDPNSLPVLKARFATLNLFLDGVSDLNGDGCDDLVVHWGGRMRFLSGKDGSVIWEPTRVSRTYCEIDDADGDGKRDFLLGNDRRGAGSLDGSVDLYSSNGPVKILTVEGAAGGSEQFGYALADLGDINHDGIGDFAVGSPNFDPASASPFGMVRFFSGADGDVLAKVESWKVRDGFGSVLSSADVNRDGRRELMVGIPSRHHEVGGVLQLNTGVVFPIGFDPMIRMRPQEFSASTGGTVRIDLNFDGGTMDYMLLASASGKGPTMLGNRAVPLTFDGVTAVMYHHPPPWFTPGAHGTTDADGHIAIFAVLGPGAMSSLVGRSIWFCGIGLDGPLGPGVHWVTTSQELRIVP